MSENNDKSGGKIGLYVTLRVVAGVVVAVGLLVGGSYAIKFFTGSTEEKSAYQQVVDKNPTLKKVDAMIDNAIIVEKKEAVVSHKEDVSDHGVTETHDVAAKPEKADAPPKDTDAHATNTADTHKSAKETREIKPVEDHKKDFGTHSKAEAIHVVRGSKFASAMIETIDFEINERSLGWRPNDIFSFFTDNVENQQLGVLEVTRRTSEKLVERIAKTGSTITFDKNLNTARTKFQNEPTKYWLPEPESEYNDAIDEVREYIERLNNGKATFHARADNLVPLLEAFEGLLGDCDESLVKREERNKSKVSTFKADDYYYYSKGVARAMKTILEAILEDFGPVLESRGAAADLHHAMVKLETASNLEPLFVQESDLSGLFANHRANMATFISHARSYVQFVIKTMTT